MKKEARIRPFWYTDVWVFPKLITIITSYDKQGRLNAAPYSHIMQYDVMKTNPRVIIGFRQEAHTFQNICDTGEFVINCPSADYLDDMMETARFFPEGVNELDHTKFTTIPSKKVKPPSIAECPQIMECTVDEVIKLRKSSGIIIGKIEALVFDEELIDMEREERLKAMNLPIGLGDADRRYYYHTTLGDITMHELMEPPGGQRGGEVVMTMKWDNGAVETLMKIPVGVRDTVVKGVEEFARENGEIEITAEIIAASAKESGMDEDFFNRFGGKKGGKKESLVKSD